MSKGPKSHHVVPNPSGGWDVKRGGAVVDREVDCGSLAEKQPRCRLVVILAGDVKGGGSVVGSELI